MRFPLTLKQHYVELYNTWKKLKNVEVWGCWRPSAFVQCTL